MFNVNHIKRAELLPNNVPCKQHNTTKKEMCLKQTHSKTSCNNQYQLPQ